MSSKQHSDEPRVVAFYLPQFHVIPENDEWWGSGFTEWTNVRRARPMFRGHSQPRMPGELGYYDLDDTSVMLRQTELAKHAGVDVFCFYHYWFSGKRLLQRPVDNFLLSDIDMPFCLSWANENWTRRWDGKDKELLANQTYDTESANDSFHSLLPYLKDTRYVRVSGRIPVLIHRADHIPEPGTFFSTWRKLAHEYGLGELQLIAAETRWNLDPLEYYCDAVTEFPPLGANTLSAAYVRPLPDLSSHFRGRLLSYPKLMRRYSARPQPDFTRYCGVMPGWDNTPRRQHNSTVYLGNTPSLFSKWIASAVDRETKARGRDGLVFINAWNEWAEGAYLEPDSKMGNAYGDAVMSGKRRHATLPVLDGADSILGSGRARVRDQIPLLRSIGLLALTSIRNYLNEGRRHGLKRSSRTQPVVRDT